MFFFLPLPDCPCSGLNTKFTDQPVKIRATDAQPFRGGDFVSALSLKRVEN